MNVLLIWDEVPETSTSYYLNNVTSNEFLDLKNVHNMLMNLDDFSVEQDESWIKINEAITEKQYCENQDSSLCSKWIDKKIEDSEIIDTKKYPIDLIIRSGIAL